MVTDKIRETANKVTFFVEQYPEKKLAEILAMFQLPAIDINAAVWVAQNQGWLAEPNAKTGEMKLLDFPLNWDFGPVVEDLKDTILFSFHQLARKEIDLEEHQMSSWTNGYLTQDVLTAIKSLLVERKLFEYELLDQQRSEKGELQFDKKGEPIMDNYIFYTLWDNAEQEWGRKQFKVEPEESATKEE